jgi:hypothetical protein
VRVEPQAARAKPASGSLDEYLGSKKFNEINNMQRNPEK